MKHTFGYLDLSNIEGGWAELYRSIPLWIEEVRKDIYEPLDKEAELDLIRLAKYGTGKAKLEAKETVLRRNLRFIVNVSRHYLHYDIEPTELIAIGNEALVDAFNKFDPERDVKFITYAVNLIRASMIDALRGISAIKLSKRAIQLINDYIKHGDLELLKEYYPERYPETLEKLEAKLDKFLSIKFMHSLDEQFDDGDKRSDMMAYKEDKVFTYGDEIRYILQQAELDPMEQAVVHLNFGLQEDEPLGMRKIAERLDTNLTKVSKLRTSAFKKLQSNERLKDILVEINESDAITWAHPSSYQSPD